MTTLPSIISRIEPQGKLFEECSLPGEGKANGAAPAHPNGIQLSKNRFLLSYTTRGFRGRDDEWSAVYQLRADGWAGPILKEGYFSQTSNEWEALGDGRKFVKQHGHPVLFGVPKGALINGGAVSHENHFVAMWRVVAREFDPEKGHVFWTSHDQEVTDRTACAMMMQFRLNDAGDDIEVTVPARRLRQKGYEQGPQICGDPSVTTLIKGFVCPVPFNGDSTEWVDMNTVNGPANHGVADGKKTGRVIPAKYRWNPDAGLYEWVETGFPLGPDLFEGSIARYRDGFVIGARMLGFEGSNYPDQGAYTRTVAWCLTKDPFACEGQVIKRPDQPNWFPMTVYSGPDGSIWRLGNCVQRKYRKGRGPLYMVRVDPEKGFEAVEHQQLYEIDVEPRVEIDGDAYLDFGKLLPHTGGREQIVVHRVNTSAVWRNPDKPWVTPSRAISGSSVYWEKIIYTEDQPAAWRFR